MYTYIHVYRKHKNLSNSMVFADFITIILQPVSCLHYGNLQANIYIASISELLCLPPIPVSEDFEGSSVATVCPPGRDTALRTAVATVTRVLP